MRNHFKGVAFVLIFLFVFAKQSIAESNYVLPYPSSMPGSKLYKAHLFLETLEKYWYFGNFGKFKYNLKTGDKYLVEAKTLFDYKQYMLAYKALKKSDAYFSRTFPYLLKAQKEGKDIAQNKITLEMAASKHIEILEELKKELPERYIWQEEKSLAVQLYLKKYIRQSIEIRQKFQ